MEDMTYSTRPNLKALIGTTTTIDSPRIVEVPQVIRETVAEPAGSRWTVSFTLTPVVNVLRARISWRKVRTTVLIATLPLAAAATVQQFYSHRVEARVAPHTAPAQAEAQPIASSEASEKAADALALSAGPGAEPRQGEALQPGQARPNLPQAPQPGAQVVADSAPAQRAQTPQPYQPAKAPVAVALPTPDAASAMPLPAGDALPPATKRALPTHPAAPKTSSAEDAAGVSVTLKTQPVPQERVSAAPVKSRDAADGPARPAVHSSSSRN